MLAQAPSCQLPTLTPGSLYLLTPGHVVHHLIFEALALHPFPPSGGLF